MKPNRPYVLSECHWPQIRKTQYELAVLPWGATEAHNHHLPYGTDNYETEALVYEAARLAWESGAKVVVLPTVPFGVNTGQVDIPLTMNMMPSTQLALLKDIAANVSASGIRRLLVANGHGGNDFKQMLRETGSVRPELLLASCNWFQSVDKDAIFENRGDHADEMETSLMIYARPELVRPLEEAGEGKAKSFRVSELNESWAWTERKWTKTTADTGIGDPRKASREKGEAYFRAVVQKLSGLMTGLAATSVDEMYG
ncbi:MAG: creatininase family protein [Bacteroidales bacterium]